MSSIFPPALSQTSLKVSKLEFLRRQMVQSLDKRGLLQSTDEFEAQVEIFPFVIEMIHVRIFGGTYSTQFLKNQVRTLRYISLKQEIYPKMFHFPKKEFLKALVENRHRLSLKESWYVLCDHYDEDVYRSLFLKRLKSVTTRMDLKRKGKFRELFEGVPLRQNLQQGFVQKVISNSVKLNRVDEYLKDIPDSRLKNDVLWNLCCPPSTDYLFNHTNEELQQFLKEVHPSKPDLVTRCIRTILDYWYDTSFSVEAFKDGHPVDSMVSGFKEFYSEENSQYWLALGPKSQEVFRRWKVVHELEDYFNRWDATNTERKEFWKGYLSRIYDVVSFRSAEALAMRLDGYWYVEFGRTGNACYRYTTEQWEQHRFTDRKRHGQINNPSKLKKWPYDDKSSHNYHWVRNFRNWIG